MLNSFQNQSTPFANSLAENIGKIVENRKMHDKILGVNIPLEKVVEVKNDKTVEVFLTGGYADFIAGRLNREVIVDKHIVLKGLNVILDINAK